MRTNIEIDEALMQSVMQTYAFKTKREAVEQGLKALQQQAAYQNLLNLGAKFDWDNTLQQERQEWS
jgi:antitoxin ParD1/3/4